MHDGGKNRKQNPGPGPHPLPTWPPLVCFQKPEEQLGSAEEQSRKERNITFPLWLTFNLRCCTHSPWVPCFVWQLAHWLFDLAGSPALHDSHVALQALADDLSGNEKPSPGKDHFTECLCRAFGRKIAQSRPAIFHSSSSSTCLEAWSRPWMLNNDSWIVWFTRKGGSCLKSGCLRTAPQQLQANAPWGNQNREVRGCREFDRNSTAEWW